MVKFVFLIPVKTKSKTLVIKTSGFTTHQKNGEKTLFDNDIGYNIRNTIHIHNHNKL